MQELLSRGSGQDPAGGRLRQNIRDHVARDLGGGLAAALAQRQDAADTLGDACKPFAAIVFAAAVYLARDADDAAAVDDVVGQIADAAGTQMPGDVRGGKLVVRRPADDLRGQPRDRLGGQDTAQGAGAKISICWENTSSGLQISAPRSVCARFTAFWFRSDTISTAPAACSFSASAMPTWPSPCTNTRFPVRSALPKTCSAPTRRH